MAEYLIQGETLESMADKIRILNGVEGNLTTAQMDNNLGEANDEVGEQADLIEQISSALEGKAGSGGGSSTIRITVSTDDSNVVRGFDANGNSLSVTSGTHDFLDGIVYVTPYCICSGTYMSNGIYLYKFLTDGGTIIVNNSGGGA